MNTTTTSNGQQDQDGEATVGAIACRFIPLHGPLLYPPSPRATLVCFGIALLVTLLVAGLR